MSKQINVALIGNPNTGKTSVFNRLTGLNQKVGNYPGITVEKKEGICKLERGVKAHILDLPGTYSLNATSLDENVVIELLLNKKDKDYPDIAIVVTDVENIKRNLLIFTQIKDLKIPTLLVINMADTMERKGISIDIPTLEKELHTKIALVSSRKAEGMDTIKKFILAYRKLPTTPCIDTSIIDKNYFNALSKAYPLQTLYKLWLVITQDVNFVNLDRNLIEQTAGFSTKTKAELKRLQQKETIIRYKFINDALKKTYKVDTNAARDFRSVLDRILTHKVYGYAIFFLILLIMFQAIYDWSGYPMDAIDGFFAYLSEQAKNTLPSGSFTNLLVEGIIPGIGGVAIFIPQISFLFLFIAVLEESGYMSRVVFLMDRFMRKFGLSGKSVVPLISGTACSIPAIMATRNIENWKERLITILVTPFTTCSARLPVYLIIISLIIPQKKIFGLNMQGITLMLLYLLGFVMAIVSAAVLNKVLKMKTKSYFVVEMPNYKIPLLKNIAYTVLEKTKSFILDAGKIILALSVVLWFLASNGPSDTFSNADEIVSQQNKNLDKESLATKVAAYKLENSYIGIMGKSIEPAIAPLGYDWKIGVALISSFAAREVFIATLATIYSIGSENEDTIKNKMQAETTASGEKLFDFACGISILLFYAFAMQCMSTLAIVKRETNSWKWPVIQLCTMTGFAYLVALIAYQALS